MTPKNHFLNVGWHTHLPRFHDEQHYRESKAKFVVSLGALNMIS